MRDVSLRCEPGTITGFLGANGAGKSTTLKMIVGLVRPDRGTATIDGRPFVELPNPTRVVGMLLDASAMHPGRSGRATLTIAARLAGVHPRRVEHLLDLVGIADAAEKRVGTYSLGMRQRLGIAQALIGEPAALILDEPANGLDPEGIAWMRTLLRDFADHGGTVLLSSHLLHEVQATADHLAVISDGAVVAAGRLDDLLAGSTVLVRSPDPVALAAALQAAQIDYVAGPGDALTVDVCGGRVTTEVVAGVARDHQVLLTELRQSETHGLEQLFFSLTAAKAGSAPGGCSMTTSRSPQTVGIDTAPSARGPIPFSRLVRVEWAKATDTRAARWLLALVALSTAGMMLVPVLAPTTFDQTDASYLRVAALGLTILLPVVAILLFTGEWSQRSIMTTFTQEPRRIRVVNAKLAVSLVLGGGGAVFGGVVTAAGLGLAAASGRALEADLSVGAITSYLLYVLLNVLAAVALGALLQNSAAAIAASFALPAAFALLGTASTLVSEWIDMSTPWNWVLENDWRGHVPQISVSVLFWVVVPLAAGVIRTIRRDVT